MKEMPQAPAIPASFYGTYEDVWLSATGEL